MFGIDSIDLSSKQNVKAIGVPLVVAIVLLGILISVGNVAYQRFTTQYDELDTYRTEESELQTKLDLLSEVEVASLDASNRTLIAVPEKNPGLFMIAQLKSLAQKYEVSVSESRVESNSKFNEDLDRAQVTVLIEGGTIETYAALLQETTTLAPLSTIETAVAERTENSTSMELGLFVYWSSLPQTLPALTEPIQTLSQSDEEILDTISSLTVPSFTVLNPTEPGNRENPFE